MQVVDELGQNRPFGHALLLHRVIELLAAEVRLHLHSHIPSLLIDKKHDMDPLEKEN
jgi:hypothetical protein